MVSGVVLGEKRCSGILIFVGIVGRASCNVTGSIDRYEWINRWERIGKLLSRCGLSKMEKDDDTDALEGKTRVLEELMRDRKGAARRNCEN